MEGLQLRVKQGWRGTNSIVVATEVACEQNSMGKAGGTRIKGTF